MKPSIDDKRRAICSNCGGWEKATDDQINAKWDTLPESIRSEYLKNKESRPDDQPRPGGDGPRPSPKSRKSS